MIQRAIRFFLQRPHLSAATLFFLLALLFMAPALLPPAGEVLGGHDMRGYYYPFYATLRQSLHNGQLPLWTPYIFNGFPLLADPQLLTFYPPAWSFYILPLNLAVSGFMLFHIWLAGMGMYLFVHTLPAGEQRGRWLPAVLAGSAFAFSGLLAGRLWAGHTIVYAVFAWTPWIMAATLWSVRHGGIRHALVAGLTVGMAILAGHIPSFFYVSIIWASFLFYLLWTEPGRRVLIVRQAAIMGLIGLGIAAVQLVPFLQFLQQSQRVAAADFAFATDYSLPPAHLITLLLPQFFGEPLEIGYWSVPTFEELAYYAGLIPILGLVLAVRKPTRLTWFLILLMVLGLWLALGRYGVLYELVYNLFPPFRFLRAPGRAAFLFLFAVTTLLGHTLNNWLDIPLEERKVTLRPVLRWTVIIGAVLGFAALAATGAVFAAVHPTDTSGRLWQQVGGYALALAVLLMGAGLLWGYLSRPGGRRQALFGGLLVVLVLADLWLFGFKMVRTEAYSPNQMWQSADVILGDPLERVLPWSVGLFEQNGSLFTALPSVFGYDALEPAAHIALTSSVADPRSTAYDVLGVRYVVAPTPQDQFTEGEGGLSLLAAENGAWVYERPEALPVARLVYQAEVIPDPAAAINRLHQPEFDPAGTAILEADPPCAIGPPPSEPGTATIDLMEPGSWQISTNSAAPALLLLAENAYPGWQVTIDGEPAEPLTAFTTIRAVCVPAGEHQVAWQFTPTIYLAGLIISLLSWIIVGFAAFQILNLPTRRGEIVKEDF